MRFLFNEHNSISLLQLCPPPFHLSCLAVAFARAALPNLWHFFFQSTVMNIQVISSSRMHFNASNALQHNKLCDCRGFSTLNPAKCCHQSGVKKLNATTRVHWAFVCFLCAEPFLLFICFPISPKKMYINCPLVNDLTHCGYLSFLLFLRKMHEHPPKFTNTTVCVVIS